MARNSIFHSCCRSLAKGRGMQRLLFVFAIFLGATLPLRADVIWLKNGRQIVAHVTRMDGTRVYYERGGSKASVALSEVDRVDSYSSPSDEVAASRNTLEEAGTGTGSRRPALQLPAPPPSPAIHDDAIDEVYLQQIESATQARPSGENRRRLARAYQAVAVFLVGKGEADAAIERCYHGLQIAPGDLDLTLTLGSLFISQNRQAEAIEILEPASAGNPRSLDAHLLLGYAYYYSENLDEAATEWRKALAIRDDPRIREALARLENERDVTNSYQNIHGGHFLLRFEGGRGGALGQQVLEALEADFQELQSDLNLSPTEKIVVLLYPNEAFRDITRSPTWAGALNDGKIRVPVSGLSSVTPQLAHMLKHELTHSFVRQATMGRCPTWFNEGLAQLEDGSSTAPFGRQLAQAFPHAPSYALLESSFTGLSTAGATVAYAKSLAALEYLRDTYGANEIRQLLGSMAAEPDFDAVLQLQLHLTYAGFDKEVGAYLGKRYGR
jgi:tetratricopeptide (TPR) repeat protein